MLDFAVAQLSGEAPVPSGCACCHPYVARMTLNQTDYSIDRRGREG